MAALAARVPRALAQVDGMQGIRHVKLGSGAIAETAAAVSSNGD